VTGDDAMRLAKANGKTDRELIRQYQEEREIQTKTDWFRWGMACGIVLMGVMVLLSR